MVQSYNEELALNGTTFDCIGLEETVSNKLTKGPVKVRRYKRIGSRRFECSLRWGNYDAKLK